MVKALLSSEALGIVLSKGVKVTDDSGLTGEVCREMPGESCGMIPEDIGPSCIFTLFFLQTQNINVAVMVIRTTDPIPTGITTPYGNIHNSLLSKR